jgi:hypothetical protein
MADHLPISSESGGELLSLLPGAAAAKQDRHIDNGKWNVVSAKRTPHHLAGRACRPTACR